MSRKYPFINDPTIAVHEASKQLTDSVDGNDMAKNLGNDMSLEDLVEKLKPVPKTYATARHSSQSSIGSREAQSDSAIECRKKTELTVHHSKASPTVRKSSERKRQ